MIVSKHCMDVFLITIMGMRKVMMMAVIITASTMIVTVMIHTVVTATMMNVKMIATGSTQRNSL
ncbi:MAG: hypothetical protein SO188_01775 [Prevotella sp.]|nr:hypothetical protein [Prevotella sp.]